MGSGNVFKDLGLDDPEARLKKAQEELRKEKREMLFVRMMLVAFALATSGLFFWVHKTDRTNEVYRAKHVENPAR